MDDWVRKGENRTKLRLQPPSQIEYPLQSGAVSRMAGLVIGANVSLPCVASLLCRESGLIKQLKSITGQTGPIPSCGSVDGLR